MHRRAQTCRLCGQKYFPASIKFHIKVCAKKEENVELWCDHCKERFPCTILKGHMEFCKQKQSRASATSRARQLSSRDSTKRRPNRGPNDAGDSPPAMMALAQPRQRQKHHPLKGLPAATSDPNCVVTPPHTHAGDGDARSHEQLPPDSSECGRGGSKIGSNNADDPDDLDEAAVVVSSDGRVACANCNRRFSWDRVGVHQDICVRVNAAAGVREGEKRDRGREHTTKGKDLSAFLSARCCRRRSSCPVNGDSDASARARGARVRSLDRERRWVARGFENQALRERSSGRHGAEKRNAYARAIDAISYEHTAQQRRQHARRPSSATGWSSSSGLESSGETEPMTWPTRRFVSTSCSPARFRRGGTSDVVRPAERIERPDSGGNGTSCGRKVEDDGNAEVRKTSMGPLGQRGDVDGGNTRKRLVHRVEFFLPSQRVRLLKKGAK